MRFETSRFGVLEVPDEELYTFLDGIPGLQGHRFALVRAPEDPRAVWIQSVVEPEGALLLIDPLLVVPSYTGFPKEDELLPLEASGDPRESLERRVIVWAGELPATLHLNLFAPILLNHEKRLAMQTPLVGSSYGPREVWPPQASPE